MIKSLHLFNIVKCFLHLPLIAFMYLTWSKSDFAIKPDNLSLMRSFHGRSAMKFGYDFYKQIIHPDDLPLWTNILKIIPQYLNDLREKINGMKQIIFLVPLRLLRKYSFSSRFLSQMVYQRMKPICLNNQLRYFICIVGSSTYKEILKFIIA